MSDPRCKCSIAISMVGDGCRYCQPQEYIDRLSEWLDEEREEFNHLQAENEGLRARVKELEATILGATMNEPSTDAWLLRQKAEAVEEATKATEIKSATDDSKCYSPALREYAQRLRTKANQLEQE